MGAFLNDEGRLALRLTESGVVATDARVCERAAAAAFESPVAPPTTRKSH